MTLVLHPRAAPPDRLRLWLGAFDRPPGELTWTVGGRRVEPAPVRPAAPAHPWGATCWTGVYEIAGDGAEAIAPGARYRVEVRERGAGGRRARLEVRTLPAEVPGGLDRWFDVLLISCFHQAEDPTGRVGRLVTGLPAGRRPQLSLLMGDQVYLDLPTIGDFPDDERKLAAKFERDYRTNWAGPGGYGRVLAAAPYVAAPDDHEYWNNFPHRSPIIQNSWSAGGRERWRKAADHLYEAFQLGHPAKLGEPVTVDVPPLSFLVLDNRSHRRDDRSRSLAPGTIERVRAWVDRVIAARGFGVVVTGQSLLDEKVGELQGEIADRMLANYGDYPALVRELARLAEAGRPVLLLTGDVHWGRVLRLVDPHGRTRFYEVICSPSSLVASVGADQVKTLGASIRRLFGGEETTWPRHGDPADPPEHFAPQVLGRRYRTEPREPLHRQRGDQVALLSFRRHGRGGLEMKVTYRPVDRPGGGSGGPAVEVGPFTLGPAT